ncbi:MAG: fibronectin type III domain-containing protein, partial [Actinomycetota bacterium]|nr:fibronectin type III domain-containing protein [Actinomycetota bacterium]
QITAVAPPLAAGAVDITVTTSAGTSTTISADQYTAVTPPTPPSPPTVTTTTPVATPPGPPTITSATAGDGVITFDLTAPVNTGSSPVTGYTATCAPLLSADGVVVASSSGAATTIVMTGLTDGTSYSCRVAATSTAGTGPASAAVTAKPQVPPAPALSAPLDVTASVGRGDVVTVSWAPPAHDGGSPVIAALVGTSPVCRACTGTIVPGNLASAEVHGLPVGRTTTIWVVAVTKSGVMSPRSTSVTVTPPSTGGCATSSVGGWLVQWNGAVVPDGTGHPPYFGSAAGQPLASAVAGLVPTPDCGGYWEYSASGQVYAFGDASYFGAPVLRPGSGMVVGMASTPDGRGYWMVTSRGAVSGFGDAAVVGSLPAMGVVPAAPIVAMAATADGLGYWLVGADGAVYAFGDAPYDGSLTGLGRAPDGRVVAIATTADRRGYWLASSGGGVYAFGDARYAGAPDQYHGAGLITSIAAAPGGGYWTVSLDGRVEAFGGAPPLWSILDVNSPVWAIAGL